MSHTGETGNLSPPTLRPTLCPTGTALQFAAPASPIFLPISGALRAKARLVPSPPGPGRGTEPGPPGRPAPGSAYRPP